MVDFEAELARFEAELATVEKQPVAPAPQPVAPAAAHPVAHASYQQPGPHANNYGDYQPVYQGGYRTVPQPTYQQQMAQPNMQVPSAAYTSYNAPATYYSAPAQAEYYAEAGLVDTQPTEIPKPKVETKKPPADPRNKGVLRQAAGQRWRDPTLDEWPENDHRIFVGDLGNEVNDDLLAKAFSKYPSFVKAKVIRDKRTNKTKGFGFVSFTDVTDFAKALKNEQGKYVGNRPVKLRKSSWEERLAPVKRGKGNKSGGQKGRK